MVQESSERSHKTFAKFLKYMLIILNFFALLAGLAALAIGIWIVMDKKTLEYIVGSNLYTSSAYILIAVGGVTILLSFLGCFGAAKEVKCLLITYFVCLIVLFLMMVIAGILGFVFKDQLENGGARVKDSLQGAMIESLRSHYGMKQHKPDQWVTDAWDYTQRSFKCCAIDEKLNFTVWQLTEWFEDQPVGVNRKKVPESCCVLNPENEFISQEFCQGTSARAQLHWPQAEYIYKKFACCAVTSTDDDSIPLASGLYNFKAWQNSSWFNSQDNYPRERVPASCCVLCKELHETGYCSNLDSKDTPDEKKIICERECPQPSDSFVNLNMCQGTSAEALLVWPRPVYLNTKGCYPMLLKEMREAAVVLGGIGIGVAILMIISMACAICLYRFID